MLQDPSIYMEILFFKQNTPDFYIEETGQAVWLMKEIAALNGEIPRCVSERHSFCNGGEGEWKPGAALPPLVSTHPPYASNCQVIPNEAKRPARLGRE